MLSRLASRSAKNLRVIAIPRDEVPNALRRHAFHTSSVTMKSTKEEKEPAIVEAVAPHPGLLNQYGLDDWKITAPIIAAVSIPIISNGMYVLNEESQLACCFFLFCTSVYKFGGKAVGDYFDARSAAILNEQNLVEDANIALAKETLAAHEALLTIHEDIAAIAEAHKEAVKKMCEVQAYKLRHKTRETFINNLEAIRDIETSYQVQLQQSMVAQSTQNVLSVIEKGDKELKNKAFKHALDILSEANIDDSKEDEIVTMFTKELHAYAKNLESKKGQVFTLTDAEQKELQADLDAYAARYGMENVKLTAAKEIKLELM